MPTANFNALFTEHAMASYAKQLALADATEDAGSWDLDLQAGALKFENGLSFAVNLLGSFGEAAGTWLWVWANRNMDLPDGVTAAARTLRDMGTRRSVPEFSESETHDGETFCHRLAMIAVGETDSGAYYRAPYEGGAAYLLIQSDVPAPPERHHLVRIQRVIAESISSFQMPQRKAIDAFFAAEGLPVEETEPQEILATAADGNLRIRFDDEGRITEMKSLLSAPTKPSGGFLKRLFRKD